MTFSAVGMAPCRHSSMPSHRMNGFPSIGLRTDSGLYRLLMTPLPGFSRGFHIIDNGCVTLQDVTALGAADWLENSRYPRILNVIAYA